MMKNLLLILCLIGFQYCFAQKTCKYELNFPVEMVEIQDEAFENVILELVEEFKSLDTIWDVNVSFFIFVFISEEGIRLKIK